MIHFDQVHKSYPGKHTALAGVSFTIEAGGLVLLTGHSGAGKTTLIKLIAALERPSSGTVRVNEHEIGKLRASAVPYLRRNMGLIFQDTRLLADRSVLANTMLPLLVTGTAKAEARQRARAALERVGLLEREKESPLALSGGDEQRLAIARAIVNRPAILIADEPTANLDRAAAERVLDIFLQFHQAGVTVLIASHDEALFGARASQILRLDHGKLIDGPGASA